MATDEAEQRNGRQRAAALTIKPPVNAVVESLADEDQVLLAHLLTEVPDFIEHPRLDGLGAAKALFGVQVRLVSPGGTRLVPYVPIADGQKANGLGVPILSVQQEQLLFLRFNYARREISRIFAKINNRRGRRPTAKETRTLLAWGHRTLTIRSEIVRFNVPLVLAMAKRTRLSGIDYNELISEGNLALLRSAEKFDCGRGFKFSTYACRAILKSFSRVAMRASRYRDRFPVEFDPSMERSDFMDKKRQGVEVDCVDELKRILVDNIADLNRVEQKVISERFALTRNAFGESAPKTLEEVGMLIGVTKERVRQIQNRALHKIRTALETEYLVA